MLSISRFKLFRKLATVNIDSSKIPQQAIEVCKMIQENGFQSYLVGGCVRDLIMGITPKDYDITTNATPDQVKNIFPKTYDTGLQHGTITVNMGNDNLFEVTTYRSEGKYTDGRRPEQVYFVQNIEEDLSRRDLSMNAIAFDPIKNKIVDPFNGTQDISDKIIRAVGNPNERFAEDGLRTMRVARFAARFGFSVDPETEKAISNNLNVLGLVAKERIRDELTKTLTTTKPSIGLKILNETGALQVANPLLNDQMFTNVDSCNGAMETKTAVLISNLPDAQKILRDLKFSNLEIKRISFLRSALDEFKKMTSVRKFLSFVKDFGPDGFEKSLSELICYAKALGVETKELEESKEIPISKKELDISGNDLISGLSLKPGPEIKKVLDSLYDKVLENPELNKKDKLLELAKTFHVKAMTSLNIIKSSQKDWWRLSDEEESAQLNKEYDFGGGLKFRAKDIPELASQVEVPAGPVEHHPEKNQLLHTNLVFDKAQKLSDDPMVWFAALLHDLGKSYTDKSIWPKQHTHEELGVPYVEQVSNLLGVSEEWKEFAKLVAEHHLKCHKAEELNKKTLRKLFELFKNDKNKFMSFITSCQADAQGRHGFEERPYPQKEHMLGQWEKGLAQPEPVLPTLAISGNDLMNAFGLKPGPALGKILKELKEIVDKNPDINQREILMDIAKRLIIA